MSAQAECSPECYLQSKTKIEPDLRLGNGLIGLSPTTEGDAAVGLYICSSIGGIRIITYDNIFVGQTHLGNY